MSSSSPSTRLAILAVAICSKCENGLHELGRRFLLEWTKLGTWLAHIPIYSNIQLRFRSEQPVGCEWYCPSAGNKMKDETGVNMCKGGGAKTSEIGPSSIIFENLAAAPVVSSNYLQLTSVIAAA